MNKIIALIFLVAGIALVVVGSQRRNSIAGASESVGKQVASKVDGEPRVTTQTVYLVGGAILIVVGGVSLLRRRP